MSASDPIVQVPPAVLAVASVTEPRVDAAAIEGRRATLARMMKELETVYAETASVSRSLNAKKRNLVEVGGDRLAGLVAIARRRVAEAAACADTATTHVGVHDLWTLDAATDKLDPDDQELWKFLLGRDPGRTLDWRNTPKDVLYLYQAAVQNDATVVDTWTGRPDGYRSIHHLVTEFGDQAHQKTKLFGKSCSGPVLDVFQGVAGTEAALVALLDGETARPPSVDAAQLRDKVAANVGAVAAMGEASVTRARFAEAIVTAMYPSLVDRVPSTVYERITGPDKLTSLLARARIASCVDITPGLLDALMGIDDTDKFRAVMATISANVSANAKNVAIVPAAAKIASLPKTKFDQVSRVLENLMGAKALNHNKLVDDFMTAWDAGKFQAGYLDYFDGYAVALLKALRAPGTALVPEYADRKYRGFVEDLAAARIVDVGGIESAQVLFKREHCLAHAVLVKWAPIFTEASTAQPLNVEDFDKFAGKLAKLSTRAPSFVLAGPPAGPTGPAGDRFVNRVNFVTGDMGLAFNANQIANVGAMAHHTVCAEDLVSGLSDTFSVVGERDTDPPCLAVLTWTVAELSVLSADETLQRPTFSIKRTFRLFNRVVNVASSAGLQLDDATTGLLVRILYKVPDGRDDSVVICPGFEASAVDKDHVDARTAFLASRKICLTTGKVELAVRYAADASAQNVDCDVLVSAMVGVDLYEDLVAKLNAEEIAVRRRTELAGFTGWVLDFGLANPSVGLDALARVQRAADDGFLKQPASPDALSLATFERVGAALHDGYGDLLTSANSANAPIALDDARADWIVYILGCCEPSKSRMPPEMDDAWAWLKRYFEDAALTTDPVLDAHIVVNWNKNWNKATEDGFASRAQVDAYNASIQEKFRLAEPYGTTAENVARVVGAARDEICRFGTWFLETEAYLLKYHPVFQDLLDGDGADRVRVDRVQELLAASRVLPGDEIRASSFAVLETALHAMRAYGATSGTVLNDTVRCLSHSKWAASVNESTRAIFETATPVGCPAMLFPALYALACGAGRTVSTDINTVFGLPASTIRMPAAPPTRASSKCWRIVKDNYALLNQSDGGVGGGGETHDIFQDGLVEKLRERLYKELEDLYGKPDLGGAPYPTGTNAFYNISGPVFQALRRDIDKFNERNDGLAQMAAGLMARLDRVVEGTKAGAGAGEKLAELAELRGYVAEAKSQPSNWLSIVKTYKEFYSRLYGIFPVTVLVSLRNDGPAARESIDRLLGPGEAETDMKTLSLARIHKDAAAPPPRGPFTKVFTAPAHMEAVIQAGVNRLVDGEKTGDHVVFGAYGYSGSGKSYTLINHQDSVYSQIQRHVQANKVADVRLIVRDLYGEVSNCEGKGTVRSEHYAYFVYRGGEWHVRTRSGQLTRLPAEPVRETSELVSSDTVYFGVDEAIPDGVEMTDVANMTGDAIQKLQQALVARPFVHEGRYRFHIRRTPNNQESSRCHRLIHIVLGQQRKCVTVMDMGGSESISDIRDSYYDTKGRGSRIVMFGDLKPIGIATAPDSILKCDEAVWRSRACKYSEKKGLTGEWLRNVEKYVSAKKEARISSGVDGNASAAIKANFSSVPHVVKGGYNIIKPEPWEQLEASYGFQKWPSKEDVGFVLSCTKALYEVTRFVAAQPGDAVYLVPAKPGTKLDATPTPRDRIYNIVFDIAGKADKAGKEESPRNYFLARFKSLGETTTQIKILNLFTQTGFTHRILQFFLLAMAETRKRTHASTTDAKTTLAACKMLEPILEMVDCRAMEAVRNKAQEIAGSPDAASATAEAFRRHLDQFQVYLGDSVKELQAVADAQTDMVAAWHTPIMRQGRYINQTIEEWRLYIKALQDGGVAGEVPAWIRRMNPLSASDDSVRAARVNMVVNIRLDGEPTSNFGAARVSSLNYAGCLLPQISSAAENDCKEMSKPEAVTDQCSEVRSRR